MALKEYDVRINGVTHRLQLDEQDAERYGKAAKAVSTKAAPAPANKAGSADNK